MKNRILGSVAAAALSISGMAVAASPAEAVSRATARYCNHHGTFKVHSYGENFKVPVEGIPDPLHTTMRIGFHTAYYICRPPGEKRVVRTVNTGYCVTHVGHLPTFVFNGVKADILVRNSHGTMNEVDNLHVDMHAPVRPGDQYCEARWFISKKWVPLASLVRVRANYWAILASWPDQHHETPAMFLDPRNDPSPNIGTGRVPALLGGR